MQLAAEFARPRRVLMRRTVRVVRHADDDGVGLPLFEALGNLDKTGIALGMDGGLCLRAAQQAVAHRHAGVFGAEIKGHECLQRHRHRHGAQGGCSAHALPAWVEIIQACKPSRPRARS